MNIITKVRLKYIIPLSFSASLSLYFASRLFSVAAHNDTPKALKGFGRWQKFKLIDIEQLSPDTRKFTFELPEKNSVLGIEPVSFVLTNVMGKWGPWNLRPYTPVTYNEKGMFQLVIKHIPNGKASGKFFELKNINFVSFMGPLVKYKWEPNKFDDVVLLCGGSGISPMFQLICCITNNSSDKTKIHLYYANKTKRDILLRKELEEIQRKFPNKLNLNFYIEKGPEEQESNIKNGYISEHELTSFVGHKKLMVFLCGPDGFIKHHAGKEGIFGIPFDNGGILGRLGYDPKQVVRF